MYDTHAKAVIKNAALTKKKKTYTSSTETGSLLSAWRCFHLQMETLGNVQLTVSKEILVEADKIGNFVVEKTNTRKKLVAEATKCTTELKNSIAALQKAKTIYDSKCKDADTAQQAHLKAKQDGNTKPKKVQEVRTRFTFYYSIYSSTSQSVVACQKKDPEGTCTLLCDWWMPFQIWNMLLSITNFLYARNNVDILDILYFMFYF